jgi:outer membrane receptor protein involved in Fe transport
MPGLTFIDFDGLGMDPQIVVRGFYGGGETESVVLLRDGRPLNALESGRVDWDLIPLAAVRSIEVVRGGASAAWGDAALGGVINVGTSQLEGRGLYGMLSGGQHGVFRAAAGLGGAQARRPYSVFADYDRLDGYREHAARSSTGLQTSFALRRRPAGSLTISTEHDWRDSDQPGPLTAAALAQSRTQVSPFHQFDRAEEQVHRVSLEQQSAGPSLRSWNAYLTSEYRRSDRIRTVPLAPDFADTKDRVLSTARLLGSAQFEMPGFFGQDTWVVGADGSLGRARSEYYDFLQGPAAAYTNASPVRGGLDQRGESTRAALAGFFHYAWEARPAVRVTLGGRLDWLHDGFEARPPSDPADRSATHLAFSPKAGVNVRLIENERQRLRAYANVTRSFKAPTLDQLFDQRTIPVPFPPFEITFANHELDPQYGTSFEAGVYHSIDFDERLSAELSLAAYHMSLRDELDFDLQTLSYKNVGRSLHRGIESGLRVNGPYTLSAFANYTLQAATSEVGENDGKYLKAIPLHFVTAGLNAGGDQGPGAGIVVSTARGIWLDDANTLELPAWTRWDARLSWRIGTVQLFADVFNLWDTEYSTTGFPDPSDPSVVYYHPAAGRVLQLGVRRDW